MLGTVLTSSVQERYEHSRERSLRGEILINVYKYMEERYREDGARLLPVVPSDRARGNVHKLKYRKCCLNIRKHFYCKNDYALAWDRQIHYYWLFIYLVDEKEIVRPLLTAELDP